MSIISKAVDARMAAEGYAQSGFRTAWDEVARAMAQGVVERATKRVHPSEDYKDCAAVLSCAISAELGTIPCRATRKAVAVVLTRHGLLDGYSSPRGLLAGVAALRGIEGERHDVSLRSR